MKKKARTGSLLADASGFRLNIKIGQVNSVGHGENSVLVNSLIFPGVKGSLYGSVRWATAAITIIIITMMLFPQHIQNCGEPRVSKAFNNDHKGTGWSAS